ncbi:MAG: hypothetical protein COW63_09760 [Bacteroidetes bacterium CG18_big_fil_WC_8_21_14_2_50_41_14]|nr:MAG: hypothetical protein COW63_09760 [Bacteroidetes bacterium CG18_big_fil_WC_8_21_14_2_50_41_14]PJB58817.1 MAG: hypothetical protein CO098_06645 [Bacteroidetes bacterium CG_4_9_14_3_um_filter_41_19]
MYHLKSISMKALIHSVLATAFIAVLVLGCKNEQVNNDPTGISGRLLRNSACKDLKSTATTNALSDSLSCAEYQFDASTHQLTIKHLNAGFNCCPGILSCKVTSSSDTIVIQEFEESQLCSCNCLFDLEIEIVGVEAGKYVIKFIEPYCGNQTLLVFDVDLEGDPEGSFCVIRNQYPWGI